MASILVIDDDPVTADLVRLVFRKNEHVEVLSANNTVSGLQTAREKMPAIILMDVLLPYPGTDGWEATAEIKRDPDLQMIPVIIVTAGDSGFGDEQKAFEAGCDGYVRKPFIPKDMYDYLVQFLPKD